MSGAKLVFVILGGLAVVVGIVLLGFTLFEPETAPCATGDMATNQLVDGRYVSRTESFSAKEDADAFICRGTPELNAEGWSIERIEATRTVPIEILVEGNGIGFVTLSYLDEASGRSLTLDTAPRFSRSFFESEVPEQHTAETVTILDDDGTVYRFGVNPDQVVLIWRAGSLEHRATAQLTQDFSLDDMVAVLETLE